MNVNNYKTFSGTDTIAFIMLPNTTPIVLGSLTTMSYSTYREKRPVSLLGKVNVAGYTRGIRTVAGTMIFTLINQHWVNELKSQINALNEFDSLKGDELPLFDIMLISANEYGSVVQGFLYGVDITGDGGVISIEDMFSENTVNYVARDLDLINNFDPLSEDLASIGRSHPSEVTVNIGGLNYDIVNDDVLPPINIVSQTENNIEVTEVNLYLENVKYDDVLINKKYKECKICYLSYYDNKKKSYIYEGDKEEGVLFKDISNLVLYDYELESFPSYVEILISCCNTTEKYIVKLL